jgi:Domain of unknown function (DUF4386)
MTVAPPLRVTEGVRSDPMRNNVRAAGIFYLITFVTSVPALLLLKASVLGHPDYVTSAGHDARVLWGCLLDLGNATTAVGTAVALFPVLKRQNESMALGFVTSRMFEAATIVVGVVSLLAVVTLRQDHVGSAADPGALSVTADALADVRDWTFLIGPGLMPAVNAVLLATLLYRSRLVPRVIPTIGLVGAPLLLAAFLATYFGVIEQVSSISGLATLPIAAWELTIGVWMVVKGFKPYAERSR